jgi:hypothetical protein
LGRAKPGWKARNWSTLLRLFQYEGRPYRNCSGRLRPPLKSSIVRQTDMEAKFLAVGSFFIQSRQLFVAVVT